MSKIVMYSSLCLLRAPQSAARIMYKAMTVSELSFLLTVIAI